jgi:YggT family protein
LRIGPLIADLLFVYLYILIARVIIDWVMMFARQWHPRGVVLMLVDVVFNLTDPPMKAIRRVIPPLQLGAISLDIGFLVLMLGVQMLAGIARVLPF